ncbi:CPBP family intramembrane glutamic endopeptidase [Tenacibaculum xiamenense]|uniref:CPBP family intramembrane glutamic endopeptidase n=1 Tax=Tenacibaculum xiamenense TaxID=1261553 RepID=UPI003893AD96
METSIILIYGTLLLSIISIWTEIKLLKRIPLWIILLALSLTLAVVFKRVSIVGLLYSVVFGISTFYFYKRKSVWLFLLIIGLAIPLFFHFSFVGFHNYKYLNGISLSPHSIPYSLYFNLDKTLIGLFIIGFSFKKMDMPMMSLMKPVGISLLIMSIFFFVLTSVLGYSKFDPKLPSFTIVWILCNLLFTCMAEEALFRGFVQKESEIFIKGKWSGIISVFIASAVFGLAHFKGGFTYVILSSIAGLFYGYVYFKSKRVEGSILLHFLFNLIHFLLFAYPALKQ